MTCASPREDSKPGESEADFRLRLHRREARDASLEDLRRRYAARFNTLGRRFARRCVAREKSQSRHQAVQTVSIADLGASLCRKVVSKTSLSARRRRPSAGRAEHEDVGRCESAVVIQQRLAELVRSSRPK